METKQCESLELPSESLEDKIRRLEEELKQARSQLEQQNKADVSGTIQENPPKKLQAKASLTPPEIYEKRKGVVDHGKEFESTMCALYALKFSMCDTISAFEMTTNNNNCGDFDDIELDVTFTNGTKNIFLFQLKHKDSKDEMTQETLTKPFFQRNKKQEKNKFYLPSYLESISKLKTKHKNPVYNPVYILYTNNSTNIVNGSQLTFKSHASLVVRSGTLIEHEGLLLNSTEKYNQFQFLPVTKNQDLEKICKQFFLFTDQNNLEMAQKNVKDLLEKILSNDIYHNFDHFIKNWWSGNYTLTKHDVIAKLTELSISPYIESISGNKSNDKSKLIETAALEFELTIVESSEDNNLQNIWTTAEDNYDFSDFIKKYAANDKAKILWFSDLSPIIVRVNEKNEERVKRTMNFLRRDLQNKRIVLVGNVNRDDFGNWCIFENLSDLNNNKELYEKVVNTFSVSLQGKQPISLKQLTDIDETIAQNITTKQLLEMSQKENLVIGKEKEKLSELHIPRTVSAVVVDLAWILKYSTRKNCVIILNCSNEFEQKLQSTNINVIQLSKFLNEEKNQLQNFILVATQDKCTSLQFEKVCEKATTSTVYAFQVLSDENCLLLFSKGKKPSKQKKFFKEEEIFEHIHTNLNVFCAPPGMGKSTLLQVLSSNCPQDCWSVSVNLIDHNHFLVSNPNEKEILNRFLHTDNSNSLDSKIQSILLRNRKIYLFLDGLDEVESECVETVLNFAKNISTDGVSVWMSSRENLRNKISNTLHVVPITIEKLSEEQQKKYIDHRLNRKYQTEEIEIIFNTMSESVHVTNSQKLLGIPLQLFIITETFLYNESMYENIKQDNIFVLTKMYNLFFEGKIKYSIEKAGVHAHQLALSSQELLERYEILALRSCLDLADFEKLHVETKLCELFVLKIKENGDKYCVIKRITDDKVIFNHQTYAEYFACVWLKKNLEKVRLLKEKWFSERYQNLRLIFDIMVAERNSLHLAVIYKNVEQVKKLIGRQEKDAAGRYALHIACSYGDNDEYDGCCGFKSKSIWYIEIINSLVPHTPNVREEDNLFQYDCIKYSQESECLYPIEKMLQENVINHKELIMWPQLVIGLLGVIELNYVHLLNAINNVYPNVINEQCHDQFPLLYAIKTLEDDSAVTKLLLDKCVDVNVQNRRGKTSLHIACQKAQIENVKKLLDRRSNVHLVDSKNLNALHYAAQSNNNNSEIIELLLRSGVDLDAQNEEGQTALQLACKQAQIENVKKLLDCGSNVHLMDRKNRNALHYAAQSDNNNSEIMELLLKAGLEIDAQDIEGRTALQFACKKGQIENTKKLLDSGSNVHLEDCENRNALHCAVLSKKNKSEIIALLLNDGIKVNAQNKEGQTALQLACLKGRIENVKKLLEGGSNVHLVDNKNSNALHYAAEPEKNNSEIIELLLKGGVDVDVQNKKDQTALQLACKSAQVENVKKLLDNGANVHLVDSKNWNALHYAAAQQIDNGESINLLVGKEIDINSQNLKKETPLHLACKSGDFENVSSLLKNGADMNAVSHKGRNILHYAVIGWDIEKVEEILSYGFDTNACDDDGVSVLHCACKNGSYHAVKVLIDRNINIHSVDKQNRTPLHYAVECTDSVKNEIIKYLIESGIDAEASDSTGKSALDYAIQRNDLDIFKILIENQKSVNIRINDVEKFLYFSVYSGCSLGLELFIKNGKDLTNIDINNEDYPLHYAAVNGVLDIDSLNNMTRFINILYAYCLSECNMSSYLDHLAWNNDQMNLIFKEVDEPLKMDERIEDFEQWLLLNCDDDVWSFQFDSEDSSVSWE